MLYNIHFTIFYVGRFTHFFTHIFESRLQQFSKRCDSESLMQLSKRCARVEQKMRAATTFATEVLLLQLAKGETLCREAGPTAAHLAFQNVSALGHYSDAIPELWTEWWRAGSKGHAVSMIEFASCLAFGAEENPLFAPASDAHSQGVGPPVLGEPSSRIGASRWSLYWREKNVTFMRQILTVEYLSRSLRVARAKMDTTSENALAGEVAAGIERHAEETRKRIEVLLVD